MVAGRQLVGGVRRQPHRGDHRGEREQQRHPGRDQGSEGQDQDDQGDRQAEDLGPAEVLAQGVVQSLADGRAADLLDPQAGMGGLHPGGRVEQRLHHRPAGLDVVGPLEQRGIADQAIVDQRFIAGGGRRLEVIGVAEVHVDVA